MADRALLSRSKLEEFKEWLVKEGWVVEPIIFKAKNPYSFNSKILQARKEGRQHPLMVYDGSSPKHLSLLDRDTDVVLDFIRARRKKNG